MALDCKRWSGWPGLGLDQIIKDGVMMARLFAVTCILAVVGSVVGLVYVPAWVGGVWLCLFGAVGFGVVLGLLPDWYISFITAENRRLTGGL